MHNHRTVLQLYNDILHSMLKRPKGDDMCDLYIARYFYTSFIRSKFEVQRELLRYMDLYTNVYKMTY